MARTRTSRLPGWLMGSGVIAVAMAVMNLGTYAFTIIAARMLGPVEYGALAALMGLLLVVNVVSLGLQATAARRVSASTDTLPHIETDMLSASYRSAMALGLLCLAAIPVVVIVLRLDSWVPAALVATTAAPLTLMGGQAGLLQGERRWGSLAAVYLALGLGRVVFGVLAIMWRADVLGAMVGVSAGAFVPAIVGWAALRHPGRRAETAPRVKRPRSWGLDGLLRETVHNSHALLAFFALSNADVVIARVVLDEHSAGLYAAGLILAKAVLFLPQFVVVIAFPTMSEVGAARTTHLKGLGLVLVIGLTAVAGAALLSGLAVIFIGGSQYSELESYLWAFALLGTLLAMLQLMVYNVVARQSQRSVYLFWAALVVLVSLSPLVVSVTFLLTTVCLLDATLLVVLVLLSLRRTSAPGGPAPEPTR